MTLAPDCSFCAVVEVNEQDIARLRTGQRAQVMFAALVQRPLTMALTRVAPLAKPLFCVAPRCADWRGRSRRRELRHTDRRAAELHGFTGGTE